MLKYMILHYVIVYFKYLAFTIPEMGQILRWGSAGKRLNFGHKRKPMSPA